MTSLMIFFPVAICGLIGAIVGFHYAGVERSRVRNIQRQHHPQDTEPYLPFVEMTHLR
ncbi:MAG: hypothetical protein WBE86_13245 [Candidatus Acidiferrales bacterium]